MRYFTPPLSFLSLSILLANTAVHADFSPRPFPFIPRALGEVYFGDRTLGEADAMLPFYGNQDGIFYVDGLGKIGSDDGSLESIGAGYRGIHNNTFLWGVYAFGDFNRVDRGARFSVVNPGLEFMTNLWDVHVNGYFPTSKQKIQGTFLGQQIGTTQYVSFSGHREFDNLINLVEETGNGVDGVIGLTPPETSYLRLFAGGYHFSFKQAQDINGVIGGVEMPLNQYFTVSVRDSYDRVQKNTALLTLRLTLGGIAKSEQPNIHERLLDPIPRHLGAWDTGAGIPSQQAYVNTGVQALTRDNIWFFSSSGVPFVAANGLSNCTFENKCNSTSFNQLTLDAIDSFSPNANLYLGPATYSTLNSVSSISPHTNALLSTLSLNEGQSIYGRNDDYKARQNEPIIGALILSGNDTIDSITLINDNGENPAGLVISGSNIRITNSKIGQYSNLTGYRSAVVIEGANNVTIANSDLIAFLENGEPFFDTATGITVDSSTNVHLLNNNILVETTQNVPNHSLATGIVLFQSTGVEIQNRRLDVKAYNSSGENNIQATASGIHMVESEATILKSLLSPERLPEEILRHPKIDPIVPAAFNVEAHNIDGDVNIVTAFGVLVDHSTASINYNLNISPSIGEANDKIQITAENIGGNFNTVVASGVIIFEGRASLQGIHLNVDGIDMNGNGFVTASGYEVGPGILGLSPSVNTIRATTVDSTATLDAMGINVHPGGRITLGYDVRQFFIVTENGQRVFPPIRIIS